ncbi:MAG: WD40 repeat domain-containing protein, partial [Proteobacteria bacterium]|nr:WD40 repeat domain-containing protein [Pseudomonadota bacterium]
DEVVAWSVASGEVALRIEAHEAPVTSASWSPDGSRIVTAAREPVAYVWSTSTGTREHTLSGHEGDVTMASWRPGGAELVTTSMDSKVRIWAAGTPRLTLEGHASGVLGAAYDPTGARLLTWDLEGHVHLWDASSGASLRVTRAAHPIIHGVAWDETGGRFAVTSRSKSGAAGSLEVRDVTTGEATFELGGYAFKPSRALFSPGGEHIAAITDGSVLFWSARDGTPDFPVHGADSRLVLDFVWSPDGEQLVTVGSDHTARVWSAEDGSAVRALEGHVNALKRAEWSPDGTRLVTVSSDDVMRIWTASGEASAALLPSGVAVTPEGYLTAPERLELGALHGVRGAEVFSLEQLAPTYNRPDLVLPRLGAQDPEHLEHLR